MGELPSEHGKAHQGNEPCANTSLDEAIEANVRVAAALFDRSATYINVVVIGGYAGYFGLWQLAKDGLSRKQTSAAALLVLISLTSFICFEVYKMVYVSWISRAKLIKVQEVKDRSALLAAFKELDRGYLDHQPIFFRLWAVSFGTSVICALAGAGVLMWALAASLLV